MAEELFDQSGRLNSELADLGANGGWAPIRTPMAEFSSVISACGIFIFMRSMCLLRARLPGKTRSCWVMVLVEGEHTLDRCFEVTEGVLRTVFDQL